MFVLVTSDGGNTLLLWFFVGTLTEASDFTEGMTSKELPVACVKTALAYSRHKAAALLDPTCHQGLQVGIRFCASQGPS